MKEKIFKGIFTIKLSSEDDVKTYTVDIDFSKMDAAAFAIVKTGISYPKMTVTDAAVFA